MATEPEIPEDWKANYNLATAIVNSHCEEDHWPMLLVRAIREIAALKHALSDPAAVHINIMRGTIPLSRANAIHIAGLPADVDKQLAENVELRATIERMKAPIASKELTQIRGSLSMSSTEWHGKEVLRRLLADRAQEPKP